MEIPPTRKKNPGEAATESENTSLRGLLGALQWLHTQSRMDIAAEVGLLQSSSKCATVASLMEGNRILRKARKNADNTSMKVRRIDDEVIVTGWSDASLKNRVDDTSTGGYVIGLSSSKILEGSREQITPISWRSYKLKRVAVSSLSAETQALRGMEDEMHMVRLAWAEMTGVIVNLSEHDEAVKQIRGVAIIDAKAIFDALTGKNQTHDMSEKRTAIELLAYLHDTNRNGTITKWVHGESNIADGMTKSGAEKIILDFLQTCKWIIVHDHLNRSAKKRREEKLGRLEDTTVINEENFQFRLAKYLRTNWPKMMVDELEEDDSDSSSASGSVLTANNLRQNLNQQ